jgi:hypothetical protein
MVVLLRYVFVLALIGVWVWAAFDVIRTGAERVRHLHKLVWLGFVVLFPALGVAAWLLLGRPETIGSRLVPPPRPSSPAPDDSPEFLRKVDEEIRRRRRAEQLRQERGTPADVGDEKADEDLRRWEEQFGDDAGEDGPPK